MASTVNIATGSIIDNTKYACDDKMTSLLL